MKILVPISKVPDTTAKISFTDNNTKFNSDGVQFIMNPTDEWFALVRAIEIKEKSGGSVTVINVGGPENEQIIRKALAIGADNAIRVDTADDDAYFVASQIAAHAKEESYDLIFTGKETIDYNGFEVGGMVAEMLDHPFVTLVSHLEIEGNTVTVKRDIEGGHEVVEVNTPCSISAQKGISEQRIPNMRGIMQARTKPLEVKAAVESEKLTQIISYELPPSRKEVKLIDPENVQELVKLLSEEAKVI
ncbi:MAG: electron transfer flavoprotein subunit beta/FixA family protein [Chitinophagales bacterium]|nr:electron transfer flavoprotein subunit beta/FixA family protein [Chitinophagales bacterium]